MYVVACLRLQLAKTHTEIKVASVETTFILLLVLICFVFQLSAGYHQYYC